LYFCDVATPIKKKAPEKRSPVKKKTPSKKRKTSNGLPLQVKFVIAIIILVLLSPFYYGYVLKSFSSGWRWVKDFGSNPHYHTYTDFNIPIPDQYSIHGIDVSSYQGKIDWQKVKNMDEGDVHISFAYIKATEGILQVDPYFQRNWREAAKMGIVCGAYHYFRPKLNSKLQAYFFLQTVNIEKGDLPMVVDIERLDGLPPAKMREELQVFLSEIEARTGSKPVIYSGLKFYQDNLQGYFDSYSLWIAHYYQPELDTSKTTNWKFWQHSDKAKVNGINHVVDFDVFSGDSLAFKKMLIQ
jgi:lysozyme